MNHEDREELVALYLCKHPNQAAAMGAPQGRPASPSAPPPQQRGTLSPGELPEDLIKATHRAWWAAGDAKKGRPPCDPKAIDFWLDPNA